MLLDLIQWRPIVPGVGHYRTNFVAFLGTGLPAVQLILGKWDCCSAWYCWVCLIRRLYFDHSTELF